MRLVYRIVLSFIFVITNTNLAFAKTKNANLEISSKAEQMEVFLNSYLQVTTHIDQIKFLLSYANVPAQEITKMTESFNESETLPEMSLVQNYIYVDGESSGIKLTSYNPLKVEYKNKTWQFDSKLTASENYSALMSIIKTKKTAGLMDLVISKAQAAEGERQKQQRRSGVAGALVGAGAAALVVVGGALVLSVALVSLPVILTVAGAALVGGAVGGYIGAKRGYAKGQEADVKSQRQAADELLHAGDLTLECTKSGVILSGTTSQGKTAIRFDREKTPPPPEPSLWAKGWRWALSWFDNEPKAVPKTTNNITRQSISTGKFGDNLAEALPGQPLPKNNSFDRALSFTKAQDNTLKRVLNCENLNDEANRCAKDLIGNCDSMKDYIEKGNCYIRAGTAVKNKECDAVYKLKAAYEGFLSLAKNSRSAQPARAGTK